MIIIIILNLNVNIYIYFHPSLLLFKYLFHLTSLLGLRIFFCFVIFEVVVDDDDDDEESAGILLVRLPALLIIPFPLLPPPAAAFTIVFGVCTIVGTEDATGIKLGFLEF